MKYDVIIVGARCAGSPTAMLLARQGYRVLLVDRAEFPSDIISSHFIHLPGVLRLKKWGLLDRVARTNCPPVVFMTADLEEFRITGQPPPAEQTTEAFCVRRKYLDKVLVEAAAEAGAEVRERFTVEDLTWDNQLVTGIRGRTREGKPVTEFGQLVVGADGMHSLVAKLVGAPEYKVVSSLTCNYYSYWSGLPVSGAEFYPRTGRFFVAAPTNDGLTIINVLALNSDFPAFRSDIEGFFLKTLELAPDFAARVRQAKREERFVGTSETRNFFRRPFGPGWALAGDAGYHRDPITAQGISDAFRDADALAEAVGNALGGRTTLDKALEEFQRERDRAVSAMYEMTCGMARLDPPEPRQQTMFAALRANDSARNGFFGTIAGTVSIREFFSPENQQRMVQATG